MAIQEWQFPPAARRELEKHLGRFTQSHLLIEDLRLFSALYLHKDPRTTRGALLQVKRRINRLLDALGRIHGVAYWQVNSAARSISERVDSIADVDRQLRILRHSVTVAQAAQPKSGRPREVAREHLVNRIGEIIGGAHWSGRAKSEARGRVHSRKGIEAEAARMEALRPKGARRKRVNGASADDVAPLVESDEKLLERCVLIILHAVKALPHKHELPGLLKIAREGRSTATHSGLKPLGGFEEGRFMRDHLDLWRSQRENRTN